MTLPIPPSAVRSPARSPDPAAPIQCTSGHGGCAEATPVVRPTTAAPLVTAAAATAATFEIRISCVNPTLVTTDPADPSTAVDQYIGTTGEGVTRTVAATERAENARLAAVLTRALAETPGRNKSGAHPKVSATFVGRSDHLMIFVTRPAPTVRPPSRIAKRRPSSMATGWISLTEMSVLSPGITISVPSGSVTTPVTSVVRK